MLSRFRSDSDIVRLNAARGARVDVHADTLAVLTCALRFCALSDGVFDITTAPLSSLWDFKKQTVPDRARLQEAAHHVGWRGITCGTDEAGPWVRLADAHAALDVGGIAKGWIADRVGALLKEHGATGYLVDMGGDICMGGRKPADACWRIGVRDPANKKRTAFVLELDEGGVVTSGTYERSFVRTGTLYHHILDPATGMPFSCQYASVTVVASCAAIAEGLSSAALVRGPAFARRVLALVPEARAFHFLDADGRQESVVRPAMSAGL